MINSVKHNPEYIRIFDLCVLNGKLTAKLDLSANVGRYFLAKYFFAAYDKDLKDVDESILVIPPLSTIVTIAWATGADVYVEKLDEAHLNSLNRVKSIFRKWFPQFSFSTKIHAKGIVSNKFGNEGYALLFSGGVDSQVSYIRNKEKKPTLISIWGTDIPINKSNFWSMVKKRLINFAKCEGRSIHFIKTNAKELLNYELLSKKYCIEAWWERVCHGILTLGLCAPLTNEEIGHIIFASSHEKGFNEPRVSNPLLYKNIFWADVEIIYDGHELSRQEKIRYYLKSHINYLSDLRVCWVQHKEYNCGLCEKCFRTITGLVLEDIDPRKCGIPIQGGIFNLIKSYFARGLIPLGHYTLVAWQNIQRLIPEKLDDNKLYSSKEFFEWFKQFDLSNYQYKGDNKLSQLVGTYYLAKYLARSKGIRYISRGALSRMMQKLKIHVLKDSL